MRKVCVVSLVLLLLMTGAAYGAGMKSLAAYFSTAASETASIVATSKDTSQTITLPLHPKDSPRALFPDAIMIATVYTSTNDSINVKVHMDVSDDGTNWNNYTAAAEDSNLTSGTANAYQVVHIATTNVPRAQYARFRLTGAHASGDTVAVSLRIRMFY